MVVQNVWSLTTPVQQETRFIRPLSSLKRIYQNDAYIYLAIEEMLLGEITTPANIVEVFFCIRILQWIMFTQDVLEEKSHGTILLQVVNDATVARDTKQLKNLEKNP